MIRINISMSGSVADAEVTEKETLTAGRKGLLCNISFGSGWEGLQKIAVCEGADVKAVPLVSNTFEIPHECLAVAGYRLRIGVMGISTDGETVIPTVWAKVGKIVEGADAGEEIVKDATPSVVAQIMESSATALDLARNVADRAERGEFNGTPGAPGEDGVSPSASVLEDGNEIVITITDKDGTTTQRIHNWLNEISIHYSLIETLNRMMNDIMPTAYRITIPRASIGNNSTITICNPQITGLTEMSPEHPDGQGNPREISGKAYLPFLQIGSYYYSPQSWCVCDKWIILKMATVPPPATDVTVYLVELPAGYWGNGSPIDLDPENTILRFSDPQTVGTQGG